MKYQKPFLKWVGGKTQILDQIMEKFPKEIKDYHELFLGGGSVLFALLTLRKHKKIKISGKIYAYDINRNLIHLYQTIQKDKDKFFNSLRDFLQQYDSLRVGEKNINRKPKNLEEAKLCKENYYYYLRTRFNSLYLSKEEIKEDEKIELAVLFLFLNKTCFRGVYRESSNGFNVPYGHYKTTPNIMTQEEIDIIYSLIKDVEFKCLTFEESIKIPRKQDFVYLDPPYAPESKNSFVGYTKDGFNLDCHKNLFSEIIRLNQEGIKFCLSNAKVDLVTTTMKDFTIQELEARRSINSKNPESKTTEVIITN